MDPNTNKFEPLTEVGFNTSKEQLRRVKQQKGELVQLMDAASTLVRPNGEPVPKHWSVFRIGKDVAIKDYTFQMKYIGEICILFELMGPVVVGEEA